jgi:hypothetical protein
MPLPKRKNNISVYGKKELMGRRQELLDRITKSDTYLPDSILHDDLDMGMLEYVKENFKVISDGTQIPIINKILTIQRWGEMTYNWSFSDEDGNMKLPFIAIIRKPDVQPGTNPIVQRTIPDRRTFYYASVPTWNGTQMGADVYKIPQPVAVDISYEVVIVCQKFRDLNRFNKIVLQNFSSRQDYTTVKGHFIPIILDKNSDNSPIDSMDGRKFYMQTYDFTMLGFLIDDEEFEIKPAVSRLFLMTEFIGTKPFEKKFFNKSIETTTAKFIADGMQTTFSVGESIGFLFSVALNGLIQEREVDYFHIAGTSKITFSEPPQEGWEVTVSYYAGRNSVFIDSYGKPLFLDSENFVYDGSSLVFTVANKIDSVINVNINGLIDEEGAGFAISGDKEVTLLFAPLVGSNIGITYIH